MTKASNGSRSIRTLIQTTQSLPASCAIPCCTSKVTCKNNRINKASDQSCLNIPAMSTDGPDREERKCCRTSFRTSGRIRGSWPRDRNSVKTGCSIFDKRYERACKTFSTASNWDLASTVSSSARITMVETSPVTYLQHKSKWTAGPLASNEAHFTWKA